MSDKSCMREGCDRKASVVPLLRVPAQGWPMLFHTPCQVIVGIECCRSHFDELDARELLTQELREAFTHLLRGRGLAPPDFERAELEPLRITSDEYRRFVSERKPDA